MRFYLGTHEPLWLERTDVPLFVSFRRFERVRRRLPRALGPWALDSGGFTEIDQHGRWVMGEDEYVEGVRWLAEGVGGLEWAAPMDWMCEPHMVERTGLSVEEHQERTVGNFLRLRDRGPFIPVLQGWTLPDYERCVGLYEAAGVDLRAEPVVGVGSVCRRQHEAEIGRIVRFLQLDCGLRLHGFGVKRSGLARFGDALASADSLAWSYRARRSDPLPGCTHKSCANCLAFALEWRAGVWGGQLALSV